MSQQEHHCVLCGYGDPTLEQLERLKKGEIAGVVHVGELVELSGETRASVGKAVVSFNPGARVVTIHPELKPPEPLLLLDDYFKRDGDRYVVQCRKTGKHTGVTGSGTGGTSHAHMIRNGTDVPVCGADIRWAARRRWRTILCSAAQLTDPRHFEGRGVRPMCRSCMRRMATVVEITEASR